MIEPDYSALIPYKICDIVALIIENYQYSFPDALQFLYPSKLYQNLSIESTKLWHLSAYKLFDMLEEEKQTGIFQFPDFV